MNHVKIKNKKSLVKMLQFTFFIDLFLVFQNFKWTTLHLTTISFAIHCLLAANVHKLICQEE